MNYDCKSLPSMRSLAAFEATFRLGSMTAAAQEQNATQPVISQRIRTLEESIGCLLFDRSGGRLTPTKQGRLLYETVSSALAKIDASVKKLHDGSRNIAPSVSISANFGFAHLWLLPRMKSLKMEFPRYNFEVNPIDSNTQGEVHDADIYIHFNAFSQKKPEDIYLAPEVVFPVCSPEFFDKYNLHKEIDAYTLTNTPLLHMDINNPRWLDWTGWCNLAGMPDVQINSVFKFNNYPLMLGSAMRGEGIALGWSYLVQDAVSNGSLLALAPRVERSDHGYILSSRHKGSAVVQPIIDWFCQEMSTGGLRLYFSEENKNAS